MVMNIKKFFTNKTLLYEEISIEDYCLTLLHTHLARRLDAFEHGKTDDGPGKSETAGDDQVKLSGLINGVCNVQSFTVPEVGGRRTGSTLRF